MNRFLEQRDMIMSELEVPDKEQAEHRYTTYASVADAFISQMGGPEAARFALATRADLLVHEGRMTEEELRTLYALIDDWPATAVVDRLAVITVVSTAGR